MLAAISFVFAASTIILAGLLATSSDTGNRVFLAACVVVGITPIGFVAGPGAVAYLPELLVAVIILAVLVRLGSTFGHTKVSAFVFVFCGYFLLHVIRALIGEKAGVIDLLRDVRPFAYITVLLILAGSVLRLEPKQRIRESWIAMSLVILLMVDALFYAATQAGMVTAGGISGNFMERTGVLRYSDYLTISIFGVANYFVFRHSYRPLRSLGWLSICGAVVLMSQNRIYALGLLIAGSWWVFNYLRLNTRSMAIAYIGAVSPTLVLAAAGIAFVSRNPEVGESLSRISEVFDFRLLMFALESRFVAPALAGGYELNIASLLFGSGIGFEFYVPWFVYRGLDPWHFSVDSLFAYTFFKYGIVGVVLWLSAVARLLWSRPWSLGNAWVWAYLIVHSGVNVPGFLLFLTVLVIVRESTWIEASVPRTIDALRSESVPIGHGIGNLD